MSVFRTVLKIVKEVTVLLNIKNRLSPPHQSPTDGPDRCRDSRGTSGNDFSTQRDKFKQITVSEKGLTWSLVVDRSTDS